MKIALIGDLHGEFPLVWPEADRLVQVGDFGKWPGLHNRWKGSRPKDQLVYFIDGNHEHFPTLSEPWRGLVHITRGAVWEVNGKRIGFLGGGTSIDRPSRVEGIDWFPAENITDEQVDRLVGPVDLLVTHTPPIDAVKAYNRVYGTSILGWFGLPEDWIDPNAVQVQKAWDRLNRPELICGHMHKAFKWKNVQMLDCGEVVVWER